MSDDEPKVYVASSESSDRHLHYSRDCPRLQGNTTNVTEKPASVYPDGWYPDCTWCGPESDDDDHSAEAGAD